jgi:hypothetical protein
MKRMARRMVCVFLLSLFSSVSRLAAQTDLHDVLGSKNTFGVTVEYSNDSSHIVLGDAENVKLGAVGIEYQRKLIANRHLVWSYAMEFRPAIVESNLTSRVEFVETSPIPSTTPGTAQTSASCVAGSLPYSYTFPGPPPVTLAGTYYTFCGRELTYAQGFSPFGFRVNLRPRHRLQPTFSSLEGYLFSTRPLPSANAGSFNFDFEFGAGTWCSTSRTTTRRTPIKAWTMGSSR